MRFECPEITWLCIYLDYNRNKNRYYNITNKLEENFDFLRKLVLWHKRAHVCNCRFDFDTLSNQIISVPIKKPLIIFMKVLSIFFLYHSSIKIYVWDFKIHFCNWITPDMILNISIHIARNKCEGKCIHFHLFFFAKNLTVYFGLLSIFSVLFSFHFTRRGTFRVESRSRMAGWSEISLSGLSTKRQKMCCL